ncbi:hypothetical protein ACNPKZ_17440 [Shewanella algae]|uniref:hypothetical protein n=1 Tax=Shewanella TaxID=22 RepID=UPI000F422102|nr:MULTISPECIES: hypothetical protein [Shewanella]AYV11420.1 hypothetical protein EEY24_00150 [Shewanella algae]
MIDKMKAAHLALRNLLLFPVVIFCWGIIDIKAASYVYEGSFVYLVAVDFIVFAMAASHALYFLKCEGTVLWAALIFWLSQLALRSDMHELDGYLTIVFACLVVYLAIAEAYVAVARVNIVNDVQDPENE